MTMVSIILPTYNRGHVISETIQSVIEQTYQLWELIIIDDGSTDDTGKIIGQFHDDRIFSFKTNHTGFIGKTRNFGLHQAKGDIIAFLDSDDIWRPDKLAFQLDLLIQYPATAFVISNAEEFGVGSVQLPNYESVVTGNLFLSMLEQEAYPFYTSTFMFKRPVIDQIGWLDESVPTTRDTHFFFRISRLFPGIFTNERLVKIRKHAHNTSAFYPVAAYINTLNMLREFFDDKTISKKQFRNLTSLCYYKMGLVFMGRREPLHAIRNFLKFNYMQPIQYKGWVRLVQSTFSSFYKKASG
jgi:glycosyltransferase involved in cell wall biosynthesis